MPAALPPTLPERCTCGSLRRAARALTQRYDTLMAASGLRVTQFSLLRTLKREGPLRISELAALQLLDRTALSRNLDPLVARKLVALSTGRDARTRVATLTAGGERALAAAEPCWAAAQVEVSAALGGERMAALMDLLADLEHLHPDAPERAAVSQRTRRSPQPARTPS